MSFSSTATLDVHCLCEVVDVGGEVTLLSWRKSDCVTVMVYILRLASHVQSILSFFLFIFHSFHLFHLLCRPSLPIFGTEHHKVSRGKKYTKSWSPASSVIAGLFTSLIMFIQSTIEQVGITWPAKSYDFHPYDHFFYKSFFIGRIG